MHASLQRYLRASSAGIGFHLPFLFVLVNLWLYEAEFVFAEAVHSINEPQMRLNLALGAGFVPVGIAWALLRARGRVSVESGAGLSLATFGLTARVMAEYLVYVGGSWLDRLEPDDAPVVIAFGLRALGLFAYAIGIGLCAGACWSDLVRSRNLPEWAQPTL